MQTQEGRAVLQGSTYHYEYNLKDHLGNVRASFDNPGTGSAREIQEDEYYSFGLRKPDYDYSNGNRYLYNGKEIQTDLTNQYDYGARFYDPVIARWTSVDPLAEQYRRWSTYNYGVDNPLRTIDPDGMGVKDVIVISTAGKELRRVKNDEPDHYYKVNEQAFNQTSSQLGGGSSDANTMFSIFSLQAKDGGLVHKSNDLISEQSGNSISVTGSMRDGNNLIGDATVALNAVFDDGSTFQTASYTAVAGGFGNGAPQNGDYTVDTYRDRSPSGSFNKGMNKDGVGFSFNLNPTFSTNRTDLRLHPDGNNEGTLGCIGLEGNGATLINFRDALRGILKQQTSIPLNINISGNPNNDGKNGKNTKGIIE